MVIYRNMRGYVEDGWLCTLTTIEFSGPSHGTNAEQVQSGTGSKQVENIRGVTTPESSTHLALPYRCYPAVKEDCGLLVT